MTINKDYNDKLILGYIEICLLRALYDSFNLEFKTNKTRKSKKFNIIINNFENSDFFYSAIIENNAFKLSLTNNGTSLDYSIMLDKENYLLIVSDCCKIILEQYTITFLEVINTVEIEQVQATSKPIVATAAVGFIKQIKAVEEIGIVNKLKIEFTDNTFFHMVLPSDVTECVKIGDYIHLDEYDRASLVERSFIQ